MTTDPLTGDAFGRVLRRCWDSGTSAGTAFEIIERDDGHIGAVDAADYFASSDRWPAPERWGCEQATGRVLDVGCGAGRHAVQLVSAGHDVIGVDASAGAVSVARERGVTAIHASIAKLPTDLGVFDTITLLGNNLGLLGGRDNAHAVLELLARVAAPAARIIGSGLDPYATDNPEHRAYHDLNRRRGRMPGHLRIRIRDGLLATDWFDYLFMSEGELAELLGSTPWRLAGTERDGASYCVCLERTSKPA